MSIDENVVVEQTSGQPKVSIITVCYNSAKTIRDTIESVINQSYPNIEYIIVDGGSTDGTIDVIKSYEQFISKWVSEPDSGIYDAMNKGIKWATGDLIGLVNSDDYLGPDALTVIVSAYLRDTNADILHGNMRFVDADRSVSYIKTSVINVSKEFIYGKMPVCHPATFVNRNTYNELGLFNIEYRNAADYEFILRCIRTNKKFVYIDNVLTNMRSGGVSNDYKTTFMETRRINILFGCNPITAWIRYCESCSKTIIYNKLSKINMFARLYQTLKN